MKLPIILGSLVWATATIATFLAVRFTLYIPAHPGSSQPPVLIPLLCSTLCAAAWVGWCRWMLKRR